MVGAEDSVAVGEGPLMQRIASAGPARDPVGGGEVAS